MLLSTHDTWNLYFRDKYITKNVMLSSFYMLRKKDKNKEFVNKKYINSIIPEYGKLPMFSQKDIFEYLKYQEEVNNTITYAEQLIVDLEAIFEHKKINGYKSKLIANLKLSYIEFVTFKISYNYALKVIDAVERVIKNMSSEGRRELMMLMEEIRCS